MKLVLVSDPYRVFNADFAKYSLKIPTRTVTSQTAYLVLAISS